MTKRIELTNDEIAEGWAYGDLAGRIDAIHRANALGARISIFAARRNAMPADPTGHLWSVLRIL